MDVRPLRERMRDVPQIGRVSFIGVKAARGEPMSVLDRVQVIEGRGLLGDPVRRGKRQVTLVQAEHLPVIAALTGHADVPPEWMRRNLVISGINLIALKTLRFRIGDDVVLEGTGPCEPCMRLEQRFGEGSFHAIRGHGGICARIVHGGVIRLADRLVVDRSEVDRVEPR